LRDLGLPITATDDISIDTAARRNADWARGQLSS
jgi:hypothetical protein